jgi:hypothetical protein
MDGASLFLPAIDLWRPICGVGADVWFARMLEDRRAARYQVVIAERGRSGGRSRAA